MRDFFRFFGLSFFSDKIAAEAPDRKVTSHFVSLFIAFVLFVAALVAADFCSFPLHYAAADGFGELVNNAFAGSPESRIILNVDGGRMTAARGDGAPAKDLIVDSFDRDSEYSAGGYNLVVDTRSMTAYDAFEVSFDGMTAEQYGELSFAAKKNVSFSIELTDVERVLTPEFIADCSAYLESMSDVNGQNYDKDISNRFAEIKASQTDDGENDKQIYELYLHAYYPALFSGSEGAPNLRNYYAERYVENDDVKNYLFVFEDMIVGSFEANGISRRFYGYCSKLPSGMVVSATDTAVARAQVKSFIMSAYGGSFWISTYLYFINSRRIFLFATIIWLGLALLSFALSRAVKRDIPKKFGEWFKVSGSFILWSAILTTLAAFVCGFFAPLDTVFALITPLFGGIMLARLAVFFVTQSARKVGVHEEAVAAQADIFDTVDINATDNHGDTTPEIAASKIIKRGNV